MRRIEIVLSNVERKWRLCRRIDFWAGRFTTILSAIAAGNGAFGWERPLGGRHWCFRNSHYRCRL